MAKEKFDINKGFKNAEVQEGFYNLPTGVYEGFIKEGTPRIEKKSDKDGDRAMLTLVVTEEGEYEGKEQRAVYDLTSQVGLNILVTELHALEVGKPTSIREAAEMMSQADGLKVRFWVGPENEKFPEYPRKVRINELLEGGKVSPDAGDGPSDDEKDNIEVGNRVSAEIDGDTYEGEVTKVKGSNATVKFDDGDVDTFDTDDLTKLDNEPSGDPDGDPTEDDIRNKMSNDELEKLAREEGLNPDNFTWDELKDELVKIVC